MHPIDRPIRRILSLALKSLSRLIALSTLCVHISSHRECVISFTSDVRAGLSDVGVVLYCAAISEIILPGIHHSRSPCILSLAGVLSVRHAYGTLRHLWVEMRLSHWICPAPAVQSMHSDAYLCLHTFIECLISNLIFVSRMCCHISLFRRSS